MAASPSPPSPRPGVPPGRRPDADLKVDNYSPHQTRLHGMKRDLTDRLDGPPGATRAIEQDHLGSVRKRILASFGSTILTQSGNRSWVRSAKRPRREDETTPQPQPRSLQTQPVTRNWLRFCKNPNPRIRHPGPSPKSPLPEPSRSERTVARQTHTHGGIARDTFRFNPLPRQNARDQRDGRNSAWRRNRNEQ